MKSLMIAAATTALSVAAVPAVSQAQEAYGTIGYANVDADDANIGAIQGRLGYRFNPYVGVEGEAAFGVNGDTIGGVDVEAVSMSTSSMRWAPMSSASCR